MTNGSSMAVANGVGISVFLISKRYVVEPLEFKIYY
jgi:hypothetical protein